VETISEKLAQQEDPLGMVFCAVDETIEVLKDAVNQKLLVLSDTEKHWLDLISIQRETIPTNKSALFEYILSFSPELKFIPQEYGL
jgi:hypothetical protein